MIKKSSTGPKVCEQSIALVSFYDALTGGNCHKSDSSNVTSEFLLYHMEVDSLIAHTKYLDEINWVDHNTIQLDFQNLYYNGHLGLFTDFHLTFDWQGDGFVKILFNLESWQA